MPTDADLRADDTSLGALAATRGSRPDKVFRWLALACGLLVLVILALITITTTKAAWPAFANYGTDYFFSTDWRPNEGKFGILAFVWGTVVISVIGIVLAVPVSVGIALFATELAPPRLRRIVTTVMDLLAAIPSVVFGLVGFLALKPYLQDWYRAIGRFCDGIPVLQTLFGTGSSGTSLLTAGIVLAIMITPIITSVTREVFATVPQNDKDGALALGATRIEMINGVVLPHSTGGLTGAVMLGLGRAMGETIAVTLLIGGTPNVSLDLLGPGDAMPAGIARYLPEASGDFQAALIGLGVVLFVLTLIVNIGSRRIVASVDARLRGAA
jgi:phosphate transport system permease protein